MKTNCVVFAVLSAFLALSFMEMGVVAAPPSNGSDSDSETDVCASKNCASGLQCVPEVVQCIRAPCPPIATCVKVEESAPEQVDPCANKRCRSGYKCVPEPEVVNCFRAPCPPLGTCVKDSTAAKN